MNNSQVLISRYYFNSTIVRKKKIIISAIICILLIFSILTICNTVSAQGSIGRIKLVKSVEIQKGDTLWSIASEYMSEEYDSLQEYIKEIKMSNGLASDTIHAGNFIIVPYYTTKSQN